MFLWVGWLAGWWVGFQSHFDSCLKNGFEGRDNRSYEQAKCKRKGKKKERTGFRDKFGADSLALIVNWKGR